MAEKSAPGDAAKKEDARNSTIQTRKPPVLSLAMLRRAIGDDVFSLDVNEVTHRVNEGVFLTDDKKQGQENQEKSVKSRPLADDKFIYKEPYIHKYWVDKVLNRNCLMVLASALSIIWSDHSEYWTWAEEQESCYPSNVKLRVPKLKDVCWLDIEGKCKTSVLSQRTMYEGAIIVKMSSQNNGFNIPVNLSLEFPDGNRQVRMERLDSLEKETWIPISIGKFEMTPKTIGEMSFSLTQTGDYWKSGLSVKGVIVTPTAENEQPK